jgi:hypothetical protein
MRKHTINDPALRFNLFACFELACFARRRRLRHPRHACFQGGIFHALSVRNGGSE